ncbi:MAG: HAD family hydrolase [Peptococcaceae bacterium]|jgi:phosphoglycolate phosphatase-like HAD superfamily hydrolase|nr:HAD family hydrolase [Peptococcaceae bacterium]
MIEESLWPRLMELALPYLATRGNRRHTGIALEFARTLLLSEGGRPEVVIPAVTLHDVGWSAVPEELQMKAIGRDADRDVNRVHEVEGVRLAGEILRESGYPESWHEEILAIIERHDSLSTAASLNDALVKDADKLWRFSEDGFAFAAARLGVDSAKNRRFLNSRVDTWLLTATGRRLAREQLLLLRAAAGEEDAGTRGEDPGEHREAPAVKAVVFDLEGTLVDFQWNLLEGERELRQVIAQSDLPLSLFSGADYAGIWNGAVTCAPAGTRPELQRRLGLVFDRWDEDALSRWSLMPGAVPALAFLRARGVAAGLVTNIGARAVTRVFERFALGGFFNRIVTRNDVTCLKPRGEGLLKCLAGLGVKEDDAFFVGDSVTDIGAAREAGVRVAVVRGGQSQPEDLAGAGCFRLLSSLAEVRTLVGTTTR